MKTPFITLLAILGFGISQVKAQEAIGNEKNWEQLKPGMSAVQVKKLLGDPIKIEQFTTVRYNSYDTSVYWRYPNNRIVVVTNYIFERVEEDRTHLLKQLQQRAYKKSKDGLVIVYNGKN
ncbi:MAG: outer membrane protein assembly factor BamE [Bacteroidia bacterium]|jgi:hypothetical protein|nr:outer membrane protein assembly factor BamE [Bacteroidia bacterium]